MNAICSRLNEILPNSLRKEGGLKLESQVIPVNFRDFFMQDGFNVLPGFRKRILCFAPQGYVYKTNYAQLVYFDAVYKERLISNLDIIQFLPSKSEFNLIEGLEAVVNLLFLTQNTQKDYLLLKDGKINFFRLSVSNVVSDVTLYFDTENEQWCVDANEPGQTGQWEGSLRIFACDRPQLSMMIA
ncbi:MAG: hypothetical protein RLZZ230_386 [Candidatus Parcubacteria bacterium]|jgi:hypothetical protein